MEYYKDYQKKLRESLGDEKANDIISEGLYLMSLGTNDFLENYYSGFSSRSWKYTIEEYQNFLIEIAGNFIKELHEVGGRKISLGGLCPIGCLPLERSRNLFEGSGCNEDYNKVARDFNEKLSRLTEKLNKELPGIKLVFSNPYDLFFEMMMKPSQFGKFFCLYIFFPLFLFFKLLYFLITQEQWTYISSCQDGSNLTSLKRSRVFFSSPWVPI